MCMMMVDRGDDGGAENELKKGVFVCVFFGKE